MKVQFLDLKKQYLNIKDEVDKAIFSVIENTSFIMGKEVASFESNFAKFIGSKYCLGVANGTDALEIAVEALNIPKNSKVLVPANSFIASSESVSRNGLDVVFVDIDPITCNIDLNDFKNKYTSDVKLAVVVHLYGSPAPIEEIMSFCKEKNIKVIEDCAQSHGATQNGKVVGTFGDLATFSFYPGKNLGAFGDAGAIVTNNEELFKKCKMIANHGRIEKYNHIFEGRNSRLDTIQAAVLDVKLKHLHKWNANRKMAAKRYLKNLENVPGMSLLNELKNSESVFHLFVIVTKHSMELKKYLSEKNIETGVHYPIALPKLEAYKHLNQVSSCKVACEMDSCLLSLPIGDSISLEEVDYVSDCVKEFFKTKV